MKSASMKGGGYYDANSSIQRSTNSQTIPLLTEAIDAMTMPEAGSAFYIVDYGSSEGKNSAQAVKSAIAAVRKRKADQTVCVVHNDLFTNDFNRLFYNIYQNQEDSYLKDSSGKTFVFASGASFYEQMIPDCSVHIGLSSWSAHWLSRSPDVRMNHIYYGGAEGETRKALHEQANADWSRFLILRSNELVPGGKLVIALPSSLGDPQTIGDDPRGSQNLMNTTLIEMLGEGLIDKDKYERFIFPFYFRTMTEVMAPLNDPASPLSKRLSVDHSSIVGFPCPMHAEYERTGDAQAYAQSYVSWLRAWSEPILARELFSASAASATDAYHMIDDFYSRIGRAVTKDPDSYIFRIELSFLVLSKQ